MPEKDALARHKRTKCNEADTEERQERVACEAGCGTTFTRRDAMMRHVKAGRCAV
jgi:hypothetical protein